MSRGILEGFRRSSLRRWSGTNTRSKRSSSTAVSALERQSAVTPRPPANEPERQHYAGSQARAMLGLELTALCRHPETVPLVIANERCEAGDCQVQVMPFDHRRVAAYFPHADADTVQFALDTAADCQRRWERTPVDARCAVFERAADLLAGEHRQRVIAAAMIGQGMTAIQAERDLCRLVDNLRFDCHFLRWLTMSSCVIDGGDVARNRNQYHGLEGFWAAITPADSVAHAAQLALAPAVMGNGVAWKPSDRAVLACYRVVEALQAAGLPPGVVNFVPADEGLFLATACASGRLAGVAYGGPSGGLEAATRLVGEGGARYERFPRVVGTGGGKGFHVVHASAHVTSAAACTARAAFEMAGQSPAACSRALVAESVFDQFAETLTCMAQALVVCHPLDYRCFMSSLLSMEAYDRVSEYVRLAVQDGAVSVCCGGRADAAVGYYVEPTVVVSGCTRHALLRDDVRGPLLTLLPVPDDDLDAIVTALDQAPYALTGAIFSRDVSWTRDAVGAVRDCAALLHVNAACSEQRPGQQSVGGARRSGTGAKRGSISYLLKFCTERSLSEALSPCSDLTYAYMDECPPGAAFK